MNNKETLREKLMDKPHKEMDKPIIKDVKVFVNISYVEVEQGHINPDHTFIALRSLSNRDASTLYGATMFLTGQLTNEEMKRLMIELQSDLKKRESGYKFETYHLATARE
jgi:hypothetical protein